MTDEYCDCATKCATCGKKKRANQQFGGVGDINVKF